MLTDIKEAQSFADLMEQFIELLPVKSLPLIDQVKSYYLARQIVLSRVVHLLENLLLWFSLHCKPRNKQEPLAT